MDADLERYRRQVRLPEIGEDGQRRLRASSVLVAGCGALGSVAAVLLVRAGVGRVVVADRDIVDRANLHRQLLYDDDDAATPTPKAQAAARHLARANPDVRCEAVVADLDRTNVPRLVESVDLVIDGADNYELRFLVNEACVRAGRPFVSGAAIGTYGLQFTVLPGETACYACLVDEIPAPGTTPTCETAGILGTVSTIVAATQATEALKVLTGRRDRVRRTLWAFDAWEGTRSEVAIVRRTGADGCPVCAQGRYDWLEGRLGGPAVRLCGRDMVQVPPPAGGRVDLDAVAAGLPADAGVFRSPFLLRFTARGCEVTLFPDGRALVRGTDDPGRARAIVAEHLGM
jgi:adenylyltransferase/sulfurtransferase